MPSANSSDRFGNRLLAGLPAPDRRRILANCEAVELQFGEVIGESGERIHDVYFPTDSFVSLITHPVRQAGLEVWLVGNEGMIGAPLILGVASTSLRAVVLGAGPAWRMTAGRFGDALGRSDALRGTLNRYLCVRLRQAAQMVACTRFHLVEARLARWLLMSRDRAHADHFHVTHELLADLLGVRRVGITKAATALRQRALIDYHRGDVVILDRLGLQAVACDCYGALETMYEQVLGGNRQHGCPPGPTRAESAPAVARATAR